ncbi:MAG: tRNA lysidine(34) synthetase TilS, partial [Synergistaceae bacterium]|nr:tRNA lysidine(34) synthetase TilS [Synergistaceae bacterium]
MKKLTASYKKLKAAGERQGWWDSEGLIVALSGGGDSVAMLWLLHRFYKGRIVAAHLDHCTREGVSHEDAVFSKELCEKWGIKCIVKTVEVFQERLTGESFEMAGRRERYTHFFETAEAEGLPFIAVGHSADDVVETQLMNLFRGTGLDGLRGIPERRGNIIRPIVDFRRDELREILSDNGIDWREDASNSDTVYKRNRVREELIPWIKENMNPNFESVMIGLAKQINAELEHKQTVTEKQLKDVVINIEPAIVCWSPAFIKNIPDV